MSATDPIYSRRTGPRGRALLALLCVASAGACLGLGGCAVTQPADAGLHPDFGAAVSQNRDAQFVPPSPEQKSNTYIPPNAARQRLALEAYEADEVELAESEG